jgi:hypothetical protein
MALAEQIRRKMMPKNGFAKQGRLGVLFIGSKTMMGTTFSLAGEALWTRPLFAEVSTSGTGSDRKNWIFLQI